MDEEIPKYRKIFVVEPSHDLSALKSYTDNIELLTTGYENIDALIPKIESNLQGFDPMVDAFVPIGRLISTMLAGLILGKIAKDTPITVGIYKNKDYEFIPVEINWSGNAT